MSVSVLWAEVLKTLSCPGVLTMAHGYVYLQRDGDGVWPCWCAGRMHRAGVVPFWLCRYGNGHVPAQDDAVACVCAAWRACTVVLSCLTPNEGAGCWVLNGHGLTEGASGCLQCYLIGWLLA